MVWVALCFGLLSGVGALLGYRIARRRLDATFAELARVQGDLAEERFARTAADERLEDLEAQLAAARAATAALARRIEAVAADDGPATDPAGDPAAASEPPPPPPAGDLAQRAHHELCARGWTRVSVLDSADDDGATVRVEVERDGVVSKGTVAERAGRLDVRLVPAYRAFP